MDRLAFYQPSSFGQLPRRLDGRIEWTAPVHGFELTTRGELLRDEPEHPRSAEEYFKIEIGALERLARPILAGKWRRLTFLYTTGEYLLNASTLNDLVVRSDERDVLWRSLRERAEREQQYQAELPADVEPAVLAALLGFGDGTDVSEVSDGSDVPEVSDGSDVPDVPEVSDGSDVS